MYDDDINAPYLVSNTRTISFGPDEADTYHGLFLGS